MARKGIDPRDAARLSVRKNGVGLAGMAGWGDNAKSGIVATPGLKKALSLASTSLGCVKMTIEGEALIGSNIRVKQGAPWGTNLDALKTHVAGSSDPTSPMYFALFRAAKQCLIVTYVPDDAKPGIKMRYAATKNAVKDAVLDLDEEIQLEEYNVSVADDLSYKEYAKRENAPKPFTEAEIMRQQHDAEETAGGYGVLARLIAANKGMPLPGFANRDLTGGDQHAKPVALPGLANLKSALPKAIKHRLEETDAEGPASNEALYEMNNKIAALATQATSQVKLRESTKMVNIDKLVDPVTGDHKVLANDKRVEVQIKEENVAKAVEESPSPPPPMLDDEEEGELEGKDDDEMEREAQEDAKNYDSENEENGKNIENEVQNSESEVEKAHEKTEIKEEEIVDVLGRKLPPKEEEEEKTDEKETDKIDPSKIIYQEEDEDKGDETDLEELDDKENLKSEPPKETKNTADEDDDDEEAEGKDLPTPSKTKNAGFGSSMIMTGNSAATNEALPLPVNNRVSTASTRKLSLAPSNSKIHFSGQSARNMSFNNGKNRIKGIVKNIADRTETYMRKIAKGASSFSSRSQQQPLSEELLNNLRNDDGKLSYGDIRRMREADEFGEFDETQLETYLSEREFAEVFRMTKDNFGVLPQWKKDKLKKKVHLL